MITMITAPEGKMYRKGDIFAKALQLCEGDTIDNYTLVSVEEYEEWKNREPEIPTPTPEEDTEAIEALGILGINKD